MSSSDVTIVIWCKACRRPGGADDIDEHTRLGPHNCDFSVSSAVLPSFDLIIADFSVNIAVLPGLDLIIAYFSVTIAILPGLDLIIADFSVSSSVLPGLDLISAYFCMTSAVLPGLDRSQLTSTAWTDSDDMFCKHVPGGMS